MKLLLSQERKLYADTGYTCYEVQELTAQGNATRASSTGAYYFSKMQAEISQLETQGLNIVNLGIGNPDLPPVPSSMSGYSSVKS